MNGVARVSERVWLIGLLVLYLGLGVAYAVRTPTWQNPDEPAHFNYVRHLAEGQGLPVLVVGDYDQAYLEQIVSARFPPTMAVDGIRYEFHQPPLYYLLLTPVALATRGLSPSGQVLALRLASLLWGLALLVLVFYLVREGFPHQPDLALATTAFVALLPQHVAAAAAIGNDIAAEAAVVATLLLVVRSFRRWRAPSPWLLGGLLAAAVLTKLTAYAVVLLVPAAFAMWPAAGKRHWRSLGIAVALAAVLSGWWLVRNGAVYGWGDPFGLARHDLVVAGQPLTGAFGLREAVAFAETAFRSFWLQLGWMGVPAADGVYWALGIVSAMAAVGLIARGWWLVRQPFELSPTQWRLVALLAGLLLLTALAMLAYNLRYWQPQGRYLFAATSAVGLFFVVGLGSPLGAVGRRAALVSGVGALLALNVYAIVHLTTFLAP